MIHFNNKMKITITTQLFMHQLLFVLFCFEAIHQLYSFLFGIVNDIGGIDNGKGEKPKLVISFSPQNQVTDSRMSTPEDFTISPEEAATFTREVLSLPSPERKLRENPKNFLDELVKLLVHRLPWQNIRAISRPQEERHLPTPLEFKQSMFSKLGGMCYELNVFC